MTNRVLNPGLVLLEVGLNAYVLFGNRASIRVVWPRVVPVVLGLAPGIALGTMALALVSPHWMKLGTFCVLLPLVFAQAAGYRRAIRSERAVGMAAGGGLGLLYSVTTLSGPPLAMLFANHGLAKREFRAALGLVRLVESSLTALAYFYAGLITTTSVRLALIMLPSVAIGVPIGAFLIRHVRPESFGRICRSFDAWVIALGLSAVLQTLHLVPGPAAYSVMALVVCVDVYLLHRYFAVQNRVAATSVARADAV
jgi:uncharacterized membrane protein YfcA